MPGPATCCSLCILVRLALQILVLPCLFDRCCMHCHSIRLTGESGLPVCGEHEREDVGLV